MEREKIIEIDNYLNGLAEQGILDNALIRAGCQKYPGDHSAGIIQALVITDDVDLVIADNV